jgi:hypothetical protein
VLNPLTGGCVKQITEGCLALDDNDTKGCGECLPNFYSAKDDTCLATKVYDSSKDFITTSNNTTTRNNNTVITTDQNNKEQDKSAGIGLALIMAVVGILLN